MKSTIITVTAPSKPTLTRTIAEVARMFKQNMDAADAHMSLLVLSQHGAVTVNRHGVAITFTKH